MTPARFRQSPLRGAATCGRFFFSSRRRHTRCSRDWSSDVCSSDLHWPLRKAIHTRERGQCFYCLRRTTPAVQCLDHVVPRAHLGRNSYRNLVSSCMECNAQKGEKAADDFLRRLYRERRLTATELAIRLRALDALASGKLRPPVVAVAKPAAN